MRNRTQVNALTNVTVSPFPQTWVGHSSYTVPAGTNVVALSDTESMSDDPSKSRRFKGVAHERKIVSRSNISSDTYTVNADTFISTGANCFWHIWGFGELEFVSHRHISKAYPKTEGQLVRETMDKFYSVSEVDNLLNVVESPELVTGIQSLYNQIVGVKRLGKFRGRNARGLLRDALQKNVSILSGGYLYYKFGVRPLVSDMRKISKNLDKYRKALRAFQKHSGTPVVVHGSVDGSFGPISADGNGNLPAYYGVSPDTNKYWTCGVVSLKNPRTVCTIRGIREIRYSLQSFRTLDYLISRFGVTGPASFLWERIPFSFVVDWFVDLSGVLNSLDNALTGSAKRITDAGMSYSWKVLCPISKLRYAPNVVDDHDGSQIAQVELSSFIRKAIVPSVSVGLSGRFGKNQLGISAALIGQMAANLVKMRK